MTRVPRTGPEPRQVAFSQRFYVGSAKNLYRRKVVGFTKTLEPVSSPPDFKVAFGDAGIPSLQEGLEEAKQQIITGPTYLSRPSPVF